MTIKGLKFIFQMLITSMVSTTLVFADVKLPPTESNKAYLSFDKKEKNLAEITQYLEQISGTDIEIEENEEENSEDETEETCYKKDEAPPSGEEDKCCGDLQFYDGRCSEAPQFSRKKCKGWNPKLMQELGESCPAGEACMQSEIEDMFGPEETAADEKLEKIIAERENGLFGKLFKPKANDKTCGSDKRCESFNCVKIPKEKKGKIKKKKNGSIKYKMSKRCKQLWLCRCVDANEKIPDDSPSAKCCPGLKPDGGKVCRDPNAMPMMYPEFSNKPPGVDPISCEISVDPNSLFNYINNTFHLRAFEFVTSTAGNTSSCVMGNINKKMKEWGTALLNDRLVAQAQFREDMKKIKEKRNELVNAKFQAHQTFTNKDEDQGERERAIAADRMTGKSMIELMIEEQELIAKYEEALMGIYKKHEQTLMSMANEYADIDGNKKVSRCRGWLTSKKNKRRWKHRYKVKDRQSNKNSETVKAAEIKQKFNELFKTDATTFITKKIYFLTDPLMPGNKSFKYYGQSFLRAGKYRRTLGKPGFAAVLVGVLVAGALGAFLPFIAIGAAVGGAVGGFAFNKMFNSKADKNEKVFLAGVRKNIYPDIAKYFASPKLNGDVDLGVDKSCIDSNFTVSSSDTYKEDQDYKDEADYFKDQPVSSEESQENSDRLPSSEEEGPEIFGGSEENSESDYSEKYESGDDEFSSNNESEEENEEFEKIEKAEGGGKQYVEGKRISIGKSKDVIAAPKCIRTAVALSELGNAAFAQFWAYSFNPKRKYDSFGGQMRTRLLQSMAGKIMQGINSHLMLMGAYRDQSINCLKNKLLDYDWGREAGIVAEADQYKNEVEGVEWQKSKQTDLDCKNCNLKGAGGAIGIKAKKIGTTSIGADQNSFNSMRSPLIPREKLDIVAINKSYAAYQESMRARNKEILAKNPNAKEFSEKVSDFVVNNFGPSREGVAKAAGFDLDKLSFSRHSRNPSGEDEKKEENVTDSNLVLESGEAAKLAAKNVAGNSSGKTDKQSAEDKKKANMDKLKQILGDDLFADLEKAREKNKGKNYTGLSDEEETSILTNVPKVRGVAERGEISTDSSMSLFKKVSKAYEREAFPRLMEKKKRTVIENKRTPSSYKSQNQQILENLK